MPEQGKLILWDEPLKDTDVLRVFADTKHWYPRSVVASALGVSKSPSLVKILESLADRYCLEKAFRTLPNGVDMVIYRRREECEGEISTWSE